jgi:amino acid transporter
VVAGLAEHTAPLVGIAEPRWVALACAVVLGSVAASGLRPSSLAWNTITVLKLAPLVLLALFLAGSDRSVPRALVTPAPGDLARAALVVVFAMQGFEIVPVPAGHARGSRRAIPFATLLSLGLAALLYIALHAACVAALPSLATTPAPLAAAGAALGGPGFGAVVAFGTNLSALGIAFGMFAMTPRYLAAIGREDGLGRWVAVEDSRGVPQRALLATALVVAALVLAGNLTELFALSSVAVLTQYGVSVAALGVLAARRRRGLGRRHLWPVPLALGAVVLLGHAARPRELLVALGVLALGVALLVARRWRSIQL